MKKLVIFYSYTGCTKKEAMQRATAEGADLFEVIDVKRLCKAKAYTAGCYHAMRGNTTPIQPITVDLSCYNKIIFMAPVWAGYPAPPMNHIFGMLPRGTEIEAVMVSASGGSKAEKRIAKLLEGKGCRLTGYWDVKSK